MDGGRKRLLRENAHELRDRSDLRTLKAPDASEEQLDAFDAAWVEGILLQAVESLVHEYHRTGRGDYFRVLYGRICEQMTIPQISQDLGITPIRAENYFKATRKRLATKLQELVRNHVERYCDADQFESEFTSEWGRVGGLLAEHGGLEQAIAKVYETQEPAQTAQRQTRAITAALRRIAQPPDDR